MNKNRFLKPLFILQKNIIKVCPQFRLTIHRCNLLNIPLRIHLAHISAPLKLQDSQKCNKFAYIHQAGRAS